MAVASVKVDSSAQNLDNNTASSAADTKPPPSCPDDDDQSPNSLDSSDPPTPDSDDRTNGTPQKGTKTPNGGSLKSEIKDLSDAFSKLNPLAKEFVPPSLARAQSGNGLRSFGQGKRRMNKRTSLAQKDDVIRRTVYVSDIDQQVTEENLAGVFVNCGQVVDCRVCGDPKSVLRFAFVEFTNEEGARAALSMSGTVLGFYPLKVLPSKTAIAPVNPTFLPRSEDEREMCVRTVYCTNIDKRVSQTDLKGFFEMLCGEVHRLRLGDYHHQTRFAFVEFSMAESAIAALNYSGIVLGALPIRVSPSKTPVRPHLPRPEFK
ncbi:Polyadenylate-binding protein-interacting protein 10 [Raphanus sativus]|nr:Polyadenylate-binding protein-interacting protein 10 [Raphanus sativus]